MEPSQSLQWIDVALVVAVVLIVPLILVVDSVGRSLGWRDDEYVQRMHEADAFAARNDYGPD